MQLRQYTNVPQSVSEALLSVSEIPHFADCAHVTGSHHFFDAAQKFSPKDSRPSPLVSSSHVRREQSLPITKDSNKHTHYKILRMVLHRAPNVLRMCSTCVLRPMRTRFPRPMPPPPRAQTCKGAHRAHTARYAHQPRSETHHPHKRHLMPHQHAAYQPRLINIVQAVHTQHEQQHGHEDAAAEVLAHAAHLLQRALLRARAFDHPVEQLARLRARRSVGSASGVVLRSNACTKPWRCWSGWPAARSPRGWPAPALETAAGTSSSPTPRTPRPCRCLRWRS
jgi:hypothetical protein